MILRVPEYYDEFSCIASACKDSCCAGWEIDIDDESYAYYSSCQGEFGDRLRKSMYRDEEDGGYRFYLKGPKRCAMLNDNNLCDLYTALGEEALCEVCTEYPRFSLLYGNVEQKCMSLSCEEVGRIVFHKTEPVHFVEHIMQNYYSQAEEDEQMADEEEDPAYIEFSEWAQNKLFSILQNRKESIWERMHRFLAWCERAQDVTNHYLARNDKKILDDFRTEDWLPDISWKSERTFSYEDFSDRFAEFVNMEVLDEEWINSKREFNELFHEDTYDRIMHNYLNSTDYNEIWYEHLLVYFTFRYLMNVVYDYDLISYAKLVIVATLVIRDMDAVRFLRNGGHYTVEDRIDVARIFSKEVEHSEENADNLKEMCMIDDIASVDALYRQI